MILDSNYKSNLLISGWYGFGNLGDEVILQSITYSIYKEIPAVDIRAYSYNPSFTEKYQKIKSFPHFPSGLRSWVKAVITGSIISSIRGLFWCDILLLGGGGFLSDWQPEAPWVWLRQALAAKILGKRVMLYGIGAGPFSRKWGSFVTRTIINYCIDVVTVRDEESKSWLAKAGVNDFKIKVTADPAVRYPLPTQNKSAAQKIKKVGICIAPIFHSEKYWPGKQYKYVRYIEAMRQVVSILVADGFTVSFIPLQESSDISFAREIIKDLPCNVSILKTPSTLNDAVDQLAEVDILITMRFHAAILGAIQGVPVAAVIYHHKVAEFIDTIGLREYSEELGDGSNWKEIDIDPDHLIKSIKAISDNYLVIQTKMQTAINKMQNLEQGNTQALAAILEMCR